MRKLTEYLIVTAGLLALNGKSQTLPDQMNFRTGEVDGAHLYGVSAFSGYSTSLYPVGQSVQAGASTLGSDVNYGASASMGWQRHREWMNLSVIYSPSYIGQAHYSNLNALNHSLSISASRKLGRKWTASLSGSGQDVSQTQFLFNPTSFAVQSQVPLTFDDLAAAFAAGQFTSTQVASMLTGAAPPASLTQSLLYGYRTLAYSTQASLVYAYSPRLSFQVSSFASGSQPLSDGSQVHAAYVVSHAIGANGGVSISYRLSPRTQLGLNVDESWIMNHYQGAYVTTATASIGRKITEHWFANVHGGYYVTRSTKSGAAFPTNQAIGGASLGVKTYEHTFTASYDRTSTDSLGFLGTATSIGGSWRWHHRGSEWALIAGFFDEQTRNTGFASLSGLEASGGVSRNLGDQTTVSAQYVFYKGRSIYSGALTDLTEQSVRLSVGWSPKPNLR
jgi:hypothetical protein